MIRLRGQKPEKIADWVQYLKSIKLLTALVLKDFTTFANWQLEEALMQLISLLQVRAIL